MIEDRDLIGKIWKQNCGDSLLVIEKSSIQEKGDKGEFLFRCLFQKYPYEIFALKRRIFEGSIINPEIERIKFIEKIWPQRCGDSVKIIKKDIKPGRWEVEFINYPYRTIKYKRQIIDGGVNNPLIEEKEFIGKVFKQNCGDNLLVLKKSNKQGTNGAFMFVCSFISDNTKVIVEKGNILKGIVNNPNFVDTKRFPWKSRESLLQVINSFKEKPTIIDICEKLNISYSVISHSICNWGLEKYIKYIHGSSFDEEEIRNFIKEYINIEIKPKRILDGKEIDIYIPSLKLGFEYNGNFWHSDYFKYGVTKLYHQEKSLLAKEKGISLVHIFEYEWLDKKQIIKFLIKSKLGIFDKKIGASKCKIRELCNLEYQNFCEENHLQGKCGARVKLGLFYKDELIQIMSFGSPRFTDKYEWEIIRECSKLGYCIIGGKEKLWKYFIRNYNPNNCISYCDFSKFTGNSYLKLGFINVGLNPPGFVWYDNNLNQIFWRDPYHNQEMKKKGYYKIYDAGQLVFSWSKKN